MNKDTRILKYLIACAYLIAVHVLLVIILLKSDFIDRIQNKLWAGNHPLQSSELTHHYHRMLGYHKRMDGNVPDGAVIFIGDSITQGLCVSAVAVPSVNYGIGSDTTFGVLKRLLDYRSISRADAVVTAIGINDFRYRSDENIAQNYQTILEQISKTTPVIISAVLPVDETARAARGWGGISHRINTLNSHLERFAQSMDNVFFVDAGPGLLDDTGNLADIYHIGDGVHLNAAGNAVWIDVLKNEVQKIRLPDVTGR